jgi:5S rRNA maturation endonuclease (ribonuclease M5)
MRTTTSKKRNKGNKTERRGPPTIDDLDAAVESLRSFDGIIVVEGKRDVAALKRLGVTKNVIHLNAPLFEVVERVADSLSPHQHVAILTDLDVEGRKLYHSLSVQLQRLGVKIDDSARKLLFRTQLRHIEGLDTFVEHLADASKSE